MSDTFLVATRIPLSRDDFERWLATPADPTLVGDPGSMFDGRYWHGDPARWSPEPRPLTPREFFSDIVDRSCVGEPISAVLVHRDGALEAYLMFLGFREYEVCTALVMFASAGRFSTGEHPALALLWAETGASLRDPREDGWLAALSVARDGAYFTGSADLTSTVAALAPAETLFFALVEQLAEAEEDAAGEFDTAIPRDPAFVDPAVLAG